MSQDYGIFITQPGTSVQGAPQNKTLMNTSIPFIKIDTQNSVGFQTITLIITNNPPEPASGGTNRTQIYKFAHGYKYIPALETLFYVTTPGAGTANTQTYFMNTGQLSSHTYDDYAVLYASADATYVYFYVEKYLGSFAPGQPNNISGTNVQITTHVFVEDIAAP